jgi:signal transduction histidine kinase
MLRLFSIESEREPWNWKAFNLGWTISETFQYHGKQIERDHLKVDVEIDEDLPDIYGDSEKFGIALNALLDNAVKFNREGGRIKILAEGRVIDGLEYAYLQIQNDGVRVPPEAKKTIFDSYTQLGDINTEKPHGVGVGLSLVRVVVEKMKGSVFLEEKDGEGASFGMLLPSEESYGALRD